MEVPVVVAGPAVQVWQATPLTLEQTYSGADSTVRLSEETDLTLELTEEQVDNYRSLQELVLLEQTLTPQIIIHR